MRKIEMYLETSIFNFVFADDSPDKRDDTIKLFNEIQSGLYVPYTSVAVIEELRRETTDKRHQMLSLLSKYDIAVIEISAEIQSLSEKYLEAGMIPVRYATDALHIAAASVAGIDVIVSWNFKHIVKRKTKLLTNAINSIEGYRNIDIYSPSEVINNDDE